MQQSIAEPLSMTEHYLQWWALTRRAWIWRRCAFISCGCCWQIWHTWNICIHQPTPLSHHHFQQQQQHQSDRAISHTDQWQWKYNVFTSRWVSTIQLSLPRGTM